MFELKEILYDTPYLNDERAPETKSLVLKERIKVTRKIKIDNQEDILSLFKMTPYYYHTKSTDKEKISSLNVLEVTTRYTCVSKKLTPLTPRFHLHKIIAR